MFDFTKYSFLDKKDLAPYCFGGNAKSTCVVVEENKTSEGVSPLLQKILAAVHLDTSKDILLYNVPKGSSFMLSNVWNEHSISYILIFGIPPQELGVNFDIAPYQPLTFQNKTFVWCHNIDTLENGHQAKQLKMDLWHCLKKVFSL